MASVLGLDLGGTFFKAAVVSDAGEVTGHRTAPSAESAGLSAWLDAALTLAGSVIDDSETEIAAIGVSVPGAVDPKPSTLVDLVDRLAVGDGISMGDALASLGVPVFADNDARAALAAERRFGAARGLDDVVMLTLGTGLGGAAVVHGEPAGGDPILGGNQIGHFTIEVDGPKCVCGNYGCAEVFASATGISRLAREAGLSVTDPPAVFLASLGDPAAAAVVDQFVAALAALVVTVIHAYQPVLILFGGGLMGSSGYFMPAVSKLAKARAWVTAGRGIALEPSQLGEHIGVLGAAAVAFERTTS